MTWISNFPGEASPLTPLVCSCFTVQFIQSRAANKITDKLPVHSFVYNLTILMRKQKLTKDVEMMSENWEVRLDLIWQKTSWLNPCKSAANLFIGPTLPTAAACCRLLPPAAACCRLLPRAMLRFWGAQEAFFKKGSCVHLPCILWSGRAEPH